MKKGLALLFWLFILAGCSDGTDLFSGLSEKDANDVIASLGDHRIEASKRTEKNGIVLSVSSKDISRAIRVLEAAGLPRRARMSIGEIFKKEGVISTPLEERARYIYALSQELESTLSQIDGVIVARVHVVLPERIAPGEPVQPASAAVFIKHSDRLEPDAVRQRIQMMVGSSIPGMAGTDAMDSGKFSIIFVPAAIFDNSEPLVNFGPFWVEERQLGFWQQVLWIAPLLGVLFLFAILLVAMPDRRRAILARISSRHSISTALPGRG